MNRCEMTMSNEWHHQLFWKLHAKQEQTCHIRKTCPQLYELEASAPTVSEAPALDGVKDRYGAISEQMVT